MELGQILERLHNVRNGNGDGQYTCRCPAHDDGRNSLSVRSTQDGKILLHCFAGCTTGDVLRALDLHITDLFEDGGNGHSDYPSVILGTYDYCGADGDILYQAVRLFPKSFRQRRQDEDGGWVWSLGDVERAPYRLPELLESDSGEWVYIVEGEKDADRLHALGLVATCNAMGAGAWRDEYNPHFGGRKVCILPDNDEPGRKHAQRVAGALQDVAATVRVVELPDLPDKGDVSDWLDDGGDAAQLPELADDATEWEPDEESTDEDTPQPGPTKTEEILGDLRDMGYLFRFNEVRERIELEDGEPLHDTEQSAIITKLYDRGHKNRTLMLDIMKADAGRNRYHPIRDFLSGLEWDGEDYVGILCGWMVCNDDPIKYADGHFEKVVTAWMRRWTIGAVGKIFDAVQNPMLVLSGGQGIGKSELARWLCSPLSDYFISSPVIPDNADHQRWLTGNFIWEVAELGATTRKADIEALKGFLTRHECTFRVPYARNEVHKQSLASFIGTVNPDNAGFLMDVTGNRRFLSTDIVAIHWEKYTENIDPEQIWAQAMHAYRQNNEAWKLLPEEEAARDRINETHGAEDPVIDAIEYLYEITPECEDGGFVSTREIKDAVSPHVKTSSDRMLYIDIAHAMRKLNVAKGRTMKERGYFGLYRRAGT